MSIKRVLIVDDEVEIRRGLSLGLTQHHFVCATCSDGISTLHELCRSRKMGIGYNYLVLDIFLPHIDGLKMLKGIKQKYRELPVVVISGYGNECARKTVLSYPNTAYLSKPFRIAMLVDALNKLEEKSTTLDVPENPIYQSSHLPKAFFFLRIDPCQKNRLFYERLLSLPGIVSCQAIRGDADIVLSAQKASAEEVTSISNKIKEQEGISLFSSYRTEDPGLDPEIGQFVQAIKEGEEKRALKTGTTSYLLIDVEPEQAKNIYTTLAFMDDVISCDVLQGGSKLIAWVYGSETAHSDTVLEKMKQTDGVLRVREEKIIKM